MCLCALGKGRCQCVEGDSECAPQLARCNCGFSAALDEFHVPSRATRRYLRRPFWATRATDGSVIALYPRPLSMTGGVASIPTHRAMRVFTPRLSFFPSTRHALAIVPGPSRLPLAHPRSKRHPNNCKHDGLDPELAWGQGARPARARCSRSRNLPFASLMDERLTCRFAYLVRSKNRLWKYISCATKVHGCLRSALWYISSLTHRSPRS